MNYKPDIELCAEFCLGDDTDCETCGMSYNMLDYAYDPVAREHRFAVRVGCTGGDNLTTRSTAEAVAFIEDYANNFPNASRDVRDLATVVAALADGHAAP